MNLIMYILLLPTNLKKILVSDVYGEGRQASGVCVCVCVRRW